MLDFEKQTFLNHGSFGALPKSVHARRLAILEQIEREPDLAFRTHLSREWHSALAILAGLTNATEPKHASGLVFVDCATLGVQVALTSALAHAAATGASNVVLLDLSSTYGACKLIVEELATAQQSHAAAVEHVRLGELPLAHTDSELIAALLSEVRARLSAQSGAHVVVLLDHIVSSTARCYGVAQIGRQLIDEFGDAVTVVVDAAHAIGQTKVDLSGELGDNVHFYVSNLHKWAYAPRGCAFLFTHESRRARTKPLLVSHCHRDSYSNAFMIQATRDDSRWRCIDAVRDFLDQAGGIDRVVEHCNKFAQNAATRLAKEWHTSIGAPDVGAFASMALIELPQLPFVQTIDDQAAFGLSSLLHKQFNIVVPVNAIAGKLFVRISAQLYSSDEDIDELAKAISALAKTTDASQVPEFKPRRGEESQDW